MILLLLILLPVAGGLVSWIVGRWNVTAARWASLLAMLLDLLIAVILWRDYWAHADGVGVSPWVHDWRWSWIQPLGISLHFAADGISLLLITLTAFLGVFAVAASWQGIRDRVGLFHFILLWSFAGITGVFLAVDLFLFYFFWEMILIPLYFLIDLWGLERRHAAAVKFFIFTQVGGLFLLLGILGLFFTHHAVSGVYTFDFAALRMTPIPPVIEFWLMLAFFIAFAVKLPAVPFHTWLPDAHTQAPVAGSVDLAGLVLKVGAYGLLRFTIPLFPVAALAFRPVAMTLGIIGILYGAMLAFSQTDIKRLVAYTSISHMGFVLLGIFAWNELGLQGALMSMIAHGIITGTLFILVGSINHRLQTREIGAVGGLWPSMPRLGGAGIVLAIGLIGLPGLASFVGEFLVLLGVYRVSPLFAALGSVGFVLSVVYAVWMVQRVFWGPPRHGETHGDLTMIESAMMTSAILVIVWLGLFPQILFDTAAPAIRQLLLNSRRSSLALLPGAELNDLSADGRLEHETTIKAELP